MKKLLLVSAVAASTLMASGYKIPEQSLNSTALAGAYVSNTSAADAAYYNPANMAFMSSDKHLELNAMYIHLNPVEYNGDIVDISSGNLGSMFQPTVIAQDVKSESSSEDFILPQFYLVSAPIGEDEDIRLGLSLNEPAGLSKRWPEGSVESLYAEEFSLKVIEVAPSISYRIMDNLAIAGGVRFVYSEGVIKTAPNATVSAYNQAVADPNIPVPGQQAPFDHMNMEGSSWDIGWNAALSYKPFDMWGMALTYRSNVDLSIEGGQTFTMIDSSSPFYGRELTAPGTVSVPLPGTLSLATDVSLTDSTNIEFVYERVFWSAYDELDLRVMGNSVNSNGEATPKNWVDTNTFRLGLTQGLGESVNLMLGFAYDQTPVPDETIGFELPDSDAMVGSIGVRWAINEEFDLGAAVLYDQKTDRDVKTDTINGTFSNSSAVLASVGLGYKF